MVTIYTDGSCGHTGKGGWAYVILKDNKYIGGDFKGYPDVTIGWLELQAVYQALKYCKANEVSATIYSDSQYVVNTINQWMHTWEYNGWRKGDQKEIKNLILVQAISMLWKTMTEVKVEWVKGHDDVFGNVMADDMANMARLLI